MQIHSRLALALALSASVTANAHDYQAGELHIDHPYARATVPNQTSGAAYLTLENKGKTGDALIKASSPIAKTVQIHTMAMDGNVMRMREVPKVELPPSTKVAMKPGDGYHIMLIGLKHQLKIGEKFPLTLTFEKSGMLEVSVDVENLSAK